MSLTSYRTAPPRVGCSEFGFNIVTGCLFCLHRAPRRRCAHALGRPGNDLLSHVLRRSTIGAEDLYGRVRNGIGCYLLAIATRSSKPMGIGRARCGIANYISDHRPDFGPAVSQRCQINRRRIVDGSCRCTRRPVVFRSGSRDPDGRPAIKPIEQLVLVSSMRYRTSTPSLSTWWSSTALERDLVSRGASRLDAFSGYPFRT